MPVVNMPAPITRVIGTSAAVELPPMTTVMLPYDDREPAAAVLLTAMSPTTTSRHALEAHVIVELEPTPAIAARVAK